MRKDSSCNVHNNYKISVSSNYSIGKHFFFPFCYAFSIITTANNNPNILLVVLRLPGCVEAQLSRRTFPFTDLAETGPHYRENVFWLGFRCPCCTASSVGDLQSLQKLPVKSQEDSVPLLKSYTEVRPTCRTQRANLPLPFSRTSPVGRNRENSRCPTVTLTFTIVSTEKWI